MGMPMRRVKTELISPGQPIEGTLRGRLFGPVISDDPQSWPRYRRLAIFDEGFEWPIIDADASSVTLRGSAAFALLADDVVNLTRVMAAEAFQSTPFTVVGSVAAFNAIAGQFETVVTLVETVPTLALDGGDWLNMETIRAAPFQKATISSVDDVNRDIVVPQVDDVSDLVTGLTTMICACDMFLADDEVTISGTPGGVNDGRFKCRSDFTNSPGITTIHLDGSLAASAGGGLITLHLPPPLRVVATGRAVLRWYRVALEAGAIVHCRRIDTRGNWWEIVSPDFGPSVPVEPDI
jgi:hypothetical protein